MTKDDYMKLSKERLAELLVERDNDSNPYIPSCPQVSPCFTSNGICTNPLRDCINCPRQFNGPTITTNKIK